MKFCTHQEEKWQIISLHIVSGGYFCQQRSPKKSITHNIWPTKEELGTETREEKNPSASGDERLSLSAALCLSAFPANLAAAGFLKGEEEEEGGRRRGSVLGCV